MLAQVATPGPIWVERLELLFPFGVSDKYPRLSLTPISRENAGEFLVDAHAAVEWLAALVGVGG